MNREIATLAPKNLSIINCLLHNVLALTDIEQNEYHSVNICSGELLEESSKENVSLGK